MFLSLNDVNVDPKINASKRTIKHIGHVLDDTFDGGGGLAPGREPGGFWCPDWNRVVWYPERNRVMALLGDCRAITCQRPTLINFARQNGWWWVEEDLNLRPHAYQACALTS